MPGRGRRSRRVGPAAGEDWLLRLDTSPTTAIGSPNGEHVSGPATERYRHRVQAAHQKAAHQKFAGRVLASHNQARNLVTNRLLQSYPGRAMTCVFDPAKALCQLRAGEQNPHRTPDQDDCRALSGVRRVMCIRDRIVPDGCMIVTGGEGFGATGSVA